MPGIGNIPNKLELMSSGDTLLSRQRRSVGGMQVKGEQSIRRYYFAAQTWDKIASCSNKPEQRTLNIYLYPCLLENWPVIDDKKKVKY